MLHQLKAEAAQFGLKMHMGKTKVLTNTVDGYNEGNIAITGDIVKVISPFDSEKY